MEQPLWECGYGHQFFVPFDNTDGQAPGVPSHCFEDTGDGEPCLDSSVLDPCNEAAELAVRAWRAKLSPEEYAREEIARQKAAKIRAREERIDRETAKRIAFAEWTLVATELVPPTIERAGEEPRPATELEIELMSEIRRLRS